MTTPSEIMDSTECAELLRCTPEKIEELARIGELPGVKLGRAWIFVRADLLLFLAEKGRAEAAERRAKRSPSAHGWPVPITRPRRQVPPKLFP